MKIFWIFGRPPPGLADSYAVTVQGPQSARLRFVYKQRRDFPCIQKLVSGAGHEPKQAGPGIGDETPDRGPLGMGYAPPPGPAAPSSGGSGTKQAPVDQVPLWLLIKPI
jgi:hypothetical protein